VQVRQTSTLRWLRLAEEKRRKKEETTWQKYNGLPIPYSDHKKKEERKKKKPHGENIMA